jgi:hypothetical protein
MKYLTSFLLVIFLFAAGLSQIKAQDNAQVQKKLALIIGNGNYPLSMLANPENDARAMKKTLTQLGFEVLEYENLTQSQMKRAIDEFGIKLKSYDVGLFFYAGHGIQSKGFNYLIPIDADLKAEAQVEYDCVQADRVVSFMEESGAKVKIIILDACRNNPFERSWTRMSNGRGLATMNAPSGTLIAYATAPGSTASDGSGSNGLYTSALLENIVIPNITILRMFQNVRAAVFERSEKQQIPWESTSLIGDFFFNPVDRDERMTDKMIPDETKKEEKQPITDRSTVPDEEYMIRNTISNIRITDLYNIPDTLTPGISDSILFASLNQGRKQGIKKGSVIQIFNTREGTPSSSSENNRDNTTFLGNLLIRSSTLVTSEGEFKIKIPASKIQMNYNQLLCRQKRLFQSFYALLLLNGGKKDVVDNYSNIQFHQFGPGLGYMIYNNIGGFVEYDKVRGNYENVGTFTFGLIKEITKTTLIKAGVGLNIDNVNIDIGGMTRIRMFSIIYSGFCSTYGPDYGCGVSFGIGFIF